MNPFSWFYYDGDQCFRNLLFFIGGGVAAEIIRRLIDRYWQWRNKDVARVNDVLFFPENVVACKDHFESVQGCLREQCSFTHQMTGLRKLQEHLLSARKSIDVCVYCISCFEMADVIIRRHKVGVRVRVITDLAIMEQAHGSQSYRFMKEGILVRTNKHSFLMHHKFVIIDDRLVAFGSFNWTSQAVTCNNESLVITNDSQIVAPFSKEFDKLWHQMEPTK